MSSEQKYHLCGRIVVLKKSNDIYDTPTHTSYVSSQLKLKTPFTLVPPPVLEASGRSLTSYVPKATVTVLSRLPTTLPNRGHVHRPEHGPFPWGHDVDLGVLDRFRVLPLLLSVLVCERVTRERVVREGVSVAVALKSRGGSCTIIVGRKDSFL